MATEYKLLVYTAAGVKVAEITDFLALSYIKQVNAPGAASFILNGEHRSIAEFQTDSQIEVWRRNARQGIDWYADFYGLFRGVEQATDGRGAETFTAFCPGQMSLLGRRHVMWYAGTPDRSEFTAVPAETVMKSLVNYNVTSAATTANGRIRNGAITGVSVQADGGLGNTISWSCAWKNLLEQLQDIAKIADGDFDLVKTGSQAWEFRYYTNQLGTDRSATVTFSLDHGNMSQPVYKLMQTDERTVAVVGGQGDQSNRATVVRTGPDYSASNDIEVFVDGRNDDTTAKLESRGDAALDGKRARNEFQYDVLQTPSSLYGLHYFLGDLVTARYKSIEVMQKVEKVSVKFEKTGKEAIKVEMRDV